MGDSAQRLVVVDSDGGIDDCIAILALLRDPSVRILALTAVFGNATLDNVRRNLGLLLAKFNTGEKIPIYAGAARGLIESNPTPWEGHGPNGLGGAEFPEVLPQTVECTHACVALTELAKEYAGQIDLITLGPLTNVALACRLDNEFASRLRSVWVMGGSHLGRGNATRSAEFNFCCDPEAAHIALAATDRTTIVTWELAEHYRLQWADMDVLYALETEAADWLKKTFRHYDRLSRSEKDHAPDVAERMFFEHTENMDAGVTICDLYLVFAYLRFDSAVQRSFARRVDVELSGRFARGSLQIDWYSEESKKHPNARIVSCIDWNQYFSFLRDDVIGIA